MRGACVGFSHRQTFSFRVVFPLLNTGVRRIIGACALLCLMYVAFAPSSAATNSRRAAPSPTPSPIAAVISVSVVSPVRAAAILRRLYPHANITVDQRSNTLVVVGPPDQVQSMRTIVQGIDVRNPSDPTVEVVALHTLKPAAIIPRLRSIFPNSQISAASKMSLLIRAVPLDMTQIKALISSLDTAPPSSAPPTSAPADTIKILTANPRSVARSISSQIRTVRASVSALLSGRVRSSQRRT